MYRAFENSKLAEFALVAALLTLLGVNTPPVFGGKDVSLSQVPQTVRDTIERETKGFDIDDLERDKDDGKIVYEVDAENDDRQIKLKIAEDGTLLQREEEMDSDALPAAVLNAVKKSVGDIDFDDIKKRFVRGRKTIYRIKGDKGNLEIELKIAEDGTILDKEVKRDDDDDDMPDDFRDIRRLFLKLRGQLKIAALGDSRVEKGIDPKYFLGEENRKYPMALNFGSGGSGLPRVQVIIEGYLVHAPKLQWVVYGISPRVFNRYYRSDEGDDIKRSSLYRSDKQQQGWPEITGELVPANAIDDDDFSAWGFDGEDGTDDDIEDEKERRDKQRDLRKGRYRFDTKRLEIFESLIQLLARRNVSMLAFTPPIHPLSIGQPCTDDDGTPREAYDELVEKMNALDKKHPNFYFIDINNKGEHNLKHKDFNNFDHLNTKGAKKLTLMLNDFIRAVDSDRKKNIGKKQRQ